MAGEDGWGTSGYYYTTGYTSGTVTTGSTTNGWDGGGLVSAGTVWIDVEGLRETAEKEEWRKEGERRAELLLWECLTSAQLQKLAEDKWFDLIGSKGRRYRLYEFGKVAEVDDLGRELATFCIHPDTLYPMADQVLAKKLLLECDEGEFLRIANRTQLVWA